MKSYVYTSRTRDQKRSGLTFTSALYRIKRNRLTLVGENYQAVYDGDANCHAHYERVQRTP
jgi:hypothetical protein